MFHYYETRYTPIEKSCFALMWAVQKLRHIILLAEFDLKYVARELSKGVSYQIFVPRTPWWEKMVEKIFRTRIFWILS